jgi:hypothetical protein
MSRLFSHPLSFGLAGATERSFIRTKAVLFLLSLLAAWMQRL